MPSSWRTIGRVRDKAKAHSRFLINYFLGHEDVSISIDSNFTETADELASEGVLSKDGEATYRFPSPLIRTIVLGALLVEGKFPPQELIPIKNGALLVRELIV